jgi:hypothetical protein
MTTERIAQLRAASEAIVNPTLTTDQPVNFVVDAHKAILECLDELEKPRWTCFHCEFQTADRAEAEAHFGDRDDDTEFTPICKWWATMSAGERIDNFQSVLRDIKAEQEECGRLIEANRSLEAENARLREALREVSDELSKHTCRDGNCPSCMCVAYRAILSRAQAALSPVAAEPKADPIRKALERIDSSVTEMRESQLAWEAKFETGGITVGDEACVRLELAKVEFQAALAAAREALKGAK